MEEFKMKAAASPTAFTSLNISYNLDSASTKVRLIHDFTQQVGAISLSLEVLVLDNTLGSIVEAAFSFRIRYFIKAFNIKSCYTNYTLEGDFVWASLIIWFQDPRSQSGSYILVRASMLFGSPAVPGIMELSIFKII